MYDPFVYLIFDPAKNEVIYVGKATKRNRPRYHLWRKDRHPLTHRLRKMRKENVEPIIKEIDCSSEQNAFDLEMGLIRLIGRKDLKKGTLLNLTDGGEGTKGIRVEFSEEHRKNIGAALKGRVPWNRGTKGKQKAWNKVTEVFTFCCEYCHAKKDLLDVKSNRNKRFCDRSCRTSYLNCKRWGNAHV